MSNNIKGITIELGGNTGPLSAALKDTEKTSRSLQGELKQVNKQLKFDTNNVTLVKQKQDLLNESIANTKEKLDTLKTAQKQVNEQFKSGNIGAEQYRAFQRELESTKSKLKSLKNEKSSISVIGTAFSEAKEKVGEFQKKLEPLENALKKVGKAAETAGKAGISVVGGAVKAAGAGLTAFASAAAAGGTAVLKMAGNAAESAHDIDALSKKMGVSTDDIQKFKMASELTDVPVETMAKSMSKLTKSMSSAADGNKTTSAAFAQLGVKVTDSSGALRDNQDVFNDSIAALGKMQNQTERDALALKIFGKSATELNPLILGGSDALKAMGDSAEKSGLILSQSALENLNKYKESVSTLKATAGQVKMVLSGTFTGALTGLVQKVTAVLPKISSSIVGIFSGKNMAASQKKLTDDLTNFFNSVISGIPNFLPKINAILISLITALANSLPNLIKTLVPPLMDGFTSLIMSLIPLVPVLLPTIVNAGIQLFTGLITAVSKIIPPLMAALPAVINSIGNTLINNLPTIIDAGFKILIGLIKGITNAIPKLIDKVVALIPVITDAITDNLPALITAGIQLIVALAQGLPKAIPAVIKALPKIINAIIDGFAKQDWGTIGKNILKGIGQGLVSGVKAIGGAIKEAAREASKTSSESNRRQRCFVTL